MRDELILAAQRAKFADWIDNHEYVAAYPSLSVCIEDQIVGGQRELREALRELLKSGAHDGPCDNEDAPDEACELHLKAYAERHERAKALLAQPAAREERERG